MGEDGGRVEIGRWVDSCQVRSVGGRKEGVVVEDGVEGKSDHMRDKTATANCPAGGTRTGEPALESTLARPRHVSTSLD